MARDSKFGEISIPTIPENEPVFIFRAKDKLAPFVLQYYAKIARDYGLLSFADMIHDAEIEFRDWQARNANLVKLPD